MFADLVETNRHLGLLLEERVSEQGNPEIIASLYRYIDDYVKFHQLTEADVVQSYLKFVGAYSNAVADFIHTRQYPDGSIAPSWAPSRIEYDLALMISTVLTWHRYRLMELLVTHSRTAVSPAVVIGCGSGIELAALPNDLAVDGFDIALGPFLAHAFPRRRFHERLFQAPAGAYGSAFLVEVLEHVDRPFELLEDVYAAIRTDGRLFMTTVTNVPQFDHRYNFQEGEIESWVAARGGRITFAEQIGHESREATLNASNTFYVVAPR